MQAQIIGFSLMEHANALYKIVLEMILLFRNVIAIVFNKHVLLEKLGMQLLANAFADNQFQ